VTINETVLEMHFHRALMTLVKKKLGLGEGAQFNFYKYSPQLEKFVGFDQAFVMSQLSDRDLFKLLKEASQHSNYAVTPTVVGIFLQFKVVQRMDRRYRKNPPPVTSSPYFRVPLYTARKSSSDKSQHELLYNLSKNNNGAFVYYVCPFLFDKSELYSLVNLSNLRMATLDSCPSDYTDNDKHYIFFDSPSSQPVWKSEPVDGEAISADGMAQQIANYIKGVSPEQSESTLHHMLDKMAKEVQELPEESEAVSSLLADALTVISVNMDSKHDA